MISVRRSGGNISLLLDLRGLGLLLPSYPVESFSSVDVMLSRCPPIRQSRVIVSCSISLTPHSTLFCLPAVDYNIVPSPPGQASPCVPLECRWAGQQPLLGSDLVMWHAAQLCDARKQQQQANQAHSHPGWPGSFWSKNQDNLQTKRKNTNPKDWLSRNILEYDTFYVCLFSYMWKKNLYI